MKSIDEVETGKGEVVGCPKCHWHLVMWLDDEMCDINNGFIRRVSVRDNMKYNYLADPCHTDCVLEIKLPKALI